jgi:Iron-containing redox enzyme
MEWSYQAQFLYNLEGAEHEVLNIAADYVNQVAIENHPFFHLAAKSRPVLEAWVTQELVVTGPFAQLLLNLAAQIDNVHVRTMVVHVAYGEHGALSPDGHAYASHPWLLHKLRESLSINPDRIYPYEETLAFLEKLKRWSYSPVQALGALGVGNEQLLIPEYEAIKQAFSACIAEAEYMPFLNSNICSDKHHSDLLQQAAGFLIRSESEARCYLEAAKGGVDARLSYYDAMFARLK